MKIYLKQNVWDAALDRIRWLFKEFPEVVVGVSGGKDSTVVLNLSLIVAREMKRLPLKVMFIDQEAEWQATVDCVRQIMTHPDIQPYWYQMPIKLTNATSVTEKFLYCWDPKEEHRWMRPKEKNSIKENRYGTERFFEMFGAILAVDFADTKTCYIAGVRCEESPSRYIAMLSHTYGGEAWGKVLNKRRQHYTFYPIYDWSFSDVWKSIHDNQWPYNRLYDLQYQYGVHIKDMRVSNVHHETAVKSLFHLQEIEPETYKRLTARIAGIDMAGKMGTDDYFVRELPFMFKDWREYRDYLLDKLWNDTDRKVKARKRFARDEDHFLHGVGDKLFKMHVQSILTNDYEFVKMDNFGRSPENALIRQIKQGKRVAI